MIYIWKYDHYRDSFHIWWSRNSAGWEREKEKREERALSICLPWHIRYISDPFFVAFHLVQSAWRSRKIVTTYGHIWFIMHEIFLEKNTFSSITLQYCFKKISSFHQQIVHSEVIKKIIIFIWKNIHYRYFFHVWNCEILQFQNFMNFWNCKIFIRFKISCS